LVTLCLDLKVLMLNNNDLKGDFASLAKSDGVMELPAEKEEYLAGEVYPIYTWNI